MKYLILMYGSQQDYNAMAGSAGAVLAGGRRDCNSAARDHSRHTERIMRGIRYADKPVVAEPLRQKPPCVFAGGTGQRLRLHVRLEPVCVVSLTKVAIPESPPLQRRGLHPARPRCHITPFALSADDRTDDSRLRRG